ncbi:hypothetical protein [Hippea alviniae]|nr:hypothetical protein [Hippea alviniae]
MFIVYHLFHRLQINSTVWYYYNVSLWVEEEKAVIKLIWIE